MKIAQILLESGALAGSLVVGNEEDKEDEETDSLGLQELEL